MTSEVKEDGTYDLYLPDSGCGIVHTWYIQAKDEVEVGQKLGEGESAESELVPIVCQRAGTVQKLIPVGRHVKQRSPIAVVEAKSMENVEEITFQQKYDTTKITERIGQLLKKRQQMQLDFNEAEASGDANRIEWMSEVLGEIDTRICEKRKELLNMYKELKIKEQKRYNSGYVLFSLDKEHEDRLTSFVPTLDIDSSVSEKPKVSVQLTTLITQKEKTHEVADRFYGRSTSTYPYMESKKGREGEPICDQYRIQVTPNHVVMAVADGCNWGMAPALAAYKASKGFVEFINKQRRRIGNTQRLAHLCLQGLCAAHNEIIAGKIEEGKLIGTTTLLGGVVGKVVLPQHHENPRQSKTDWVFVFASVGDCKAFLWVDKYQRIEELTPDSRNENAADASDCGGRLGPYIDGGPDLRNLEVFMSPCVEGDIIFVCSDGVHDNFDPQQHGMTPADFGLDAPSWKEGDPGLVNQVKSEFRCKKMEEIVGKGDDVTVKTLTERLVAYCEKTNLPSQQFMQEFPGKRLPHDYSRFPGKMDHTTLVALRVGDVSAEALRAYKREAKLRQAERTKAGAETVPPAKQVELEESKREEPAPAAETEAEKGGLVEAAMPGQMEAARTASAELVPPSEPAPVPASKVARQLARDAALRLRTLTNVAIASVGGKEAQDAQFAQMMKLAITHTTALTEYAKKQNLIAEADQLKAATTKCIAYAKIVFDQLSTGTEEAKKNKIQSYQALVAQCIHKIVVNCQ
mmetsp:Transcript_1556/g.5485  ORF Transcript_1556/g.5485 Transcript_1556/m.5485 type:complete len:745 (+) Transcript_1556:203-2437(+)